jgi:SAM-dependent methyltransferase
MNPIPDPLLEPLADNAKIVEMLVRTTGRTPAEVRRLLLQEECDIGSGMREEMLRRGAPFHVVSPQLDGLYAESDVFLYELVAWNRKHQKLAMRKWIAEFLARRSATPLNILSFGDGIGFDSLHLAKVGHQVTYFEVGDKLIRFAEDLFRLHATPVTICTEMRSLQPESFDAILCLDVLEHVSDPPALVGSLSQLLKPEGLLFVSAPFCMVSPIWSTHLQSNRKFSGRLKSLYGVHGLQLLDGRSAWDPIVFIKESRRPIGGSAIRRLMLRLMGWGMIPGRYTSFPYVTVANLVHHRSQFRNGLM